SLRKDATGRRVRGDGSERDVAMLLARVDILFVGEELEGGDESRPRLGRPDDRVDVAARGRGVRARELGLVLLDESSLLRIRIRSRGNLVLEDDRDGTVRAHDRDLRRRPREVDVAAD